MNDTELRARVREALERTYIMALSTIDEDGGPWTSPVQTSGIATEGTSGCL
jgi:Pyridoxamine 5'-phosphate oxidase